MISKAIAIGRKADKLLDQNQRKRFNALAGIEKLLVTKLLSELSEQIEETNGRITSRKGFVSLSKAVDRVFDLVAQERLGEFAAAMAGDMGAALKMNARYYQALNIAKKGAFADIQASVDARMRKRLGIDKEGGIQRKGYLSGGLQFQGASEEVKNMVAKAVAGGIPMRKLKRDIRMKVAGTKTAAGVLEKHLGGFILDAYQVADSVTNNAFAERLNLKYFIYSGGLIETSRKVCVMRNNKVFTTEEALKLWPEQILKYGPMTKEERESGVLTDYQPLEDRGRWRCRHRLLYIPFEEAVRRRPDLAKLKVNQ